MSRPSIMLALFLGSALLAGCSPEAPDAPEFLGATHLAFRGHAELARDTAGSWQPFYPSTERAIGLCFDAPAELDTTLWRLQIRLGSDSSAPAKSIGPATRLGNTLCFEHTPPEDRMEGWTELCAVLVDEFDGRTAPLPCQPIRLARRDPLYYEHIERFNGLMGQIRDLSSDALLERLESMEQNAHAAGFPLLALRCSLASAYFERSAGTVPLARLVSTLRSARPGWLDGAHAEEWVGQFSYEIATMLARDPERRTEAWGELRTAEESYGRIADPRSVLVGMRQAEMLSRVGAIGEGLDRLRVALDRCEQVDCPEFYRGAARTTFSWMALQDPEARVPLLRAIEANQREALVELAGGGQPLERANAEINLAFARTRLGEDPRPALERSRALLDSAESQTERRNSLRLWSKAVDAQGAIVRGELSAAETTCSNLANTAGTPRMVAWAHACLARVQRATGRLTAARASIQRSRVLQAFGVEPFEIGAPLGSGFRSEVTFLSALLALDDSDPAAAWAILEETDRSDGTLPNCPLPAGPQAGEAWNELLLELTALEGPASRTLREARQVERHGLMTQAEELLRARQACAPRVTGALEVSQADFRAFALNGEIALLRRRPSGRVETYRRTEMNRESLHGLLDALDGSADPEGPSWNSAMESLAAALAPRAEDLANLTVIAAHGELQQIPWGALPMSGGDYLGERTTVVHRPAGAPAERAERAVPATGPLFVVDPTENLSGGSELAADYRRLFPNAEVLHGAAATSTALRRRLADAAWLHIDAHGVFEPSFPELSSVVLADGNIPAAAWASETPPMQLANLSTCGGGRWPVTMDSGRFGLAGWLARRQTDWVIAARSDLPNELALDFNRAFYRELRAGKTADHSYREAIRAVAASHPPREWGALILLQGNVEKKQGENPAARTLDIRESQGGGNPASDSAPPGGTR